MSLESLFPMQKEKVIEQAQIKIAECEKEKKDNENDVIKIEMGKRFFKAKTEEIAKKRIDRDWMSVYHFRLSTINRRINWYLDILKAAENTHGDIVYLSAADADIFN